jgi:hypothetical protein
MRLRALMITHGILRRDLAAKTPLQKHTSTNRSECFGGAGVGSRLAHLHVRRVPRRVALCCCSQSGVEHQGMRGSVIEGARDEGRIYHLDDARLWGRHNRIVHTPHLQGMVSSTECTHCTFGFEHSSSTPKYEIAHHLIRRIHKPSNLDPRPSPTNPQP